MLKCARRKRHEWKCVNATPNSCILADLEIFHGPCAMSHAQNTDQQSIDDIIPTIFPVSIHSLAYFVVHINKSMLIQDIIFHLIEMIAIDQLIYMIFRLDNMIFELDDMILLERAPNSK